MSWIEVLIRATLTVVVGTLIGIERARHRRAAGMRTHILVCLGSAMTAMTSLYVSQTLGINGDVFRISAQVISGVGFLGAGMIILRNNQMITGLTTAAGVWATGAIGLAIGYGFYVGAGIATAVLMIVIIVFARFERQKKSTQVIYIEIDDMYRTNAILKELEALLGQSFTFQTVQPKSKYGGHLGLFIITEKRIDCDIATLTQIDNVVFATEEE